MIRVSLICILVSLFTGACALQKEPLQGVSSCHTNASIKAFQETLYPLLSQNCATCHGSSKVPLMASPLVRRSYEQALTVVSFENPERSRLVKKAGDGHCGDKCESLREPVRQAIADWAQREAGETQTACAGDGGPKPPPSKEEFTNPRTIFTAAVTLPANLKVSTGTGAEDFDLITLPLPSGLVGTFTIEAQRYTVRDSVDSGSYRFRRPRLYIPTSGSPLYVKDIGVSVNDATLSVHSTYHAVDSAIAPVAAMNLAPLLSPLVTDPVPQEKESGDTVTISFSILRTTEYVECRDIAKFESLVRSPATGVGLQATCVGCHNGTHPRGADYRIRAGETVQDTCRRVLQRITPQAPQLSALIRNPSTGANGHTLITGDFTPWLEWIEAERN